ncbi:IclR family transcriptional regulator [Verticiella sediminum]|nr:IclR family transcriptional regulator [Verticiella sediminum]
MRASGIIKSSATASGLPVTLVSSASAAVDPVPDAPGVGSLPKGLAILEALARADAPMGVTELARELGMGKSGVHRLLRMLCDLGWVREAQGRYACSLRIWEVGMRVADRLDLRQVAAPFLRELADATSETVHLSILDGIDVLYVDKIDSPQPVRAYSRVGGRAPAGCVATGKVLLAYAEAARVAEASAAMAPYTPRTIVDPQELEAELRRVRQQGYAVNRGEWRASVCGLAAPVFDARGEVVAALGISGPADRLTQKAMRAFEPAVTQAAHALSLALGHVRAQAPA